MIPSQGPWAISLWPRFDIWEKKNNLYVSLKSWYLYEVVTQNMLLTNEGKYVFFEKKKLIFDCSQANQMPWTDQITEIAPCTSISELPFIIQVTCPEIAKGSRKKIAYHVEYLSERDTDPDDDGLARVVHWSDLPDHTHKVTVFLHFNRIGVKYSFI